MKNTIAERIYDFLKDYPPFNFLQNDHLRTICENVLVGYHEKGDVLFETNEVLHDSFYVVKDGAIGIFRDNDILVDECDEGDIFGLRALIRNSDYRLGAKALEESIVYGISSELLEKFIITNTDASKFLMASFAANTLNPHLNKDNVGLYSMEGDSLQGSAHIDQVQNIQLKKAPVWCDGQTKIVSAALTMTSEKVGSIIITKDNRPQGIITDKDLRTKVATGKFKLSDDVSQIMSAPVITVSEDTSIGEAQITMLRNKITHLCITKDGTMNSELVGVLSEHDIVVTHSNNPSFLIKEIKRAENPEKLKEVRKKSHGFMKRYLEQHIPVFFVAKIISAVNEAICQKAIELSLCEMGKPAPTTFAWLSLGSQGRGEQLLPTDQDNAMVFADVPDGMYKESKSYFLELATLVNEKLNIVGFEMCPAEMMASNPKWCLSLSEWKKQFNNWITEPDEDKIMLSTIFFDYERVFGDQELVDGMTDSIFGSIHGYGIFLNFLALNAIKNPPPLSFFRQFIVENDGAHRDMFDIKTRALMPLVDAARVLILSNHVKDCNGTIHRYQKLAELEPQNKELYNTCGDAFKILLRFRAMEGLNRGDSGRFIDLGSLSKTDRLRLKGCFGPIKAIQLLIKVRFNLSQFL